MADALLNDLRVGGYFQEFDDARSGDFVPLRFVPRGGKVVPGLITTKRPELEGKNMIKRRIVETAREIWG